MADNYTVDSDAAGQTIGVSHVRKGAAERFEKYKSWFGMEMRRQEANRWQMALDEDYYDGIQWSPEEEAELRRRGQNPIVFNEIKPSIDWLIGTERRMRRDFKVVSRNSDAADAAADAEIKTKLLKYLDDVNRAPFERSMAAKDAWQAGLGWREIGIRADPEDEPIYVRWESWRNVIHDSLSRPDLSDCRYLFRFRELDLDIAQTYFPHAKAELERASNMDEPGLFTSGWSNGWPTSGLLGSATMPAKWIQYDSGAWQFNARRRVLLIECWCYEPYTDTTGKGVGTFDRARQRMHVAIMTENEIIMEGWSPYRHNRFPFVPVWAYRRKKDGMPYSPIRQLRGPQDDLNKRMSKAIHLLSVNRRRIEASAIDKKLMPLEKLREEAAAPDGIEIYADGALAGGRVQVQEHGQLAQAHVMLGERNSEAIRSMSGVTGENRAMDTNARSGKAIIAKQNEGSMLTAELFDNLLLADQMEGEITVSLIEQYYTEPKVFAITGERYKLDYVRMNQVDPVTGQRINDVTRHKAAFVIGQQPWRQSLAEAAFESAMEMLGRLAPVAPNVVTSIIDLVFEWSDLPNKQAILQRIRQATGMSDPDEGESPEQQAQRAQQAKLAQAQFEAQMAQLRADIAQAQAKGIKLTAEAVAKRLETLHAAAMAAQLLAATPTIMPVADELLRSAGFEDQTVPSAVLDMPGVASAAPITSPDQVAQPAADAAPL